MKTDSVTVVYSAGSRVEVPSEILHRDSVRDTGTVSRMIQSGGHEIITEKGINTIQLHSNQGNLCSPANIIAIRSDRVTLESTLENGSKSQMSCRER